MLLPYDLDATFSAAFALILVDIITPATDLLWDLQRVFSYIDEFTAREINPARSLKADLQELLDLHTKLQASNGYMQRHDEAAQTFEQDSSTSGAQGQHHGTLDQDIVWSWMTTDDGDLRGLHPDTIQSVINGLNVESMDLPEFDLLHDYDIWGARSLATNPGPMT